MIAHECAAHAFRVLVSASAPKQSWQCVTTHGGWKIKEEYAIGRTR